VSSLVAMAVLLGLSGFFSGSETALFSLRREHLRALGRGRGRFVRRLLHDPKSLLITILFGNLLVNILFYSVSVTLVVRLYRDGHTAAATALGVAAPFLVIIFGEVGPKSLAVHVPRAIAELAAAPLVLLRAAILPIRVVLGVFTEGVLRLLAAPRAVEPLVTAEELKQLLEGSQLKGTLRPDEGRMLRELIDLGRLCCREVMVPRVDLVMCPVDEGAEAFIDLVCATGRRRIPVYEETKDHVLGVVDARDVLAFEVLPHGQGGGASLGSKPAPQALPAAPAREPLRGATLRECLRRIAFVPESKSVESLLREFRQTHTAMAVVVDEYGGTAGLVTLHDILGAIAPAAEPLEGLVREIDAHTYRVGGRLSIRDWNEHPAFSVELERRGTDTIGGFVMSLLGRIPAAGDTATHRNLRFTVEQVGRRRIDTLTVEVLPQRSGPGPEGDQSGDGSPDRRLRR